ncbi:MAG: EAL domain-containing protein [Sulfurimonas sp.]|uniref:bifunctional diguanylate cyclase/phosphodiesterase n=1 Tax=Sulfurimonas sp. TaxID=2022749 RepID=UPI0026058B65|nr:EAL domain-containing protein [Sulfurimonas sp.]MCW8894835.1 EAL domain-containing protein [Sulfurimonas sp.]MCW8953653.1 EAL domain-containing protein [Sulfurimonas sp.]MCW9067704.1 EAL domain-containing protein [Sulfurimonas sp.]
MYKNIKYTSVELLIPLSLIGLLVFTSFNFHYLVFHEFAEYFAIFVSLGISLITYYTYSFTKNRYLLFIGLGYFWVAILDLLHTQTYSGMPLYNVEGSDTSITFWISARIFEASILLIAPFMRYVEYKKYKVTLVFMVISFAIIVLAMNYPPKMLIPGEGLTTLKVGLEYFVISILLVTLYVNKRHAGEFTEVIGNAVKYSIILTIAAEASFTLYIDVYGVMNVVGHIFKFLSFWILLQAIIRTSLKDPFRLMQKEATTYNAIPYPAIVVDKDGIIRQVNRAACKEVNKAESEIVGFRNHDIYHPKNIDEKSCPICESIEELEDCILRDVDLDTVKQYSISTIHSDESSVSGMVQVIVDMTIKTELEKKVKEQKEELTYKSYYDSLTKLPNRILIQDRIVHAITKANYHKKEFALLLIDLDQFKEINDTWGHQVGDAVLKRFTTILQTLISEEDTLGRLGGDEFIIIVEELQSREAASELAQKILDNTKESINIDGHDLYISSSIGISFYPKDSDTMSDLLKYSDSAMYKAKSDGRNNFQIYYPEMTEHTMRKVIMQNDLRNAIENKEFVVYYQPQIDVSGDKDTLIGLEALVRWEHPELGQIPPFSFIQIAEETGLIVEIDRLVMIMAITQVVQWFKEGLNPGKLSLNLAMKQLKEDDFIATVQKIIKDSGCSDENALSFEITESDLMTNPESSIEKLNMLKEMGIKIAIDDFGTGYSSLSYLKRLPVSKLKIDQSFIRGVPDDKDDVAIVKTIISLAKNLNIKIIAEGVETLEQKEFMYENGCSEIQGYFYSKPMSSEDTKKFIALYQ